jgi:hypothetical protein
MRELNVMDVEKLLLSEQDISAASARTLISVKIVRREESMSIHF